MGLFRANFEFVKLKEIFKGEPEWEKAFALFHCLSLRDRMTAEHSIEVGYYAARIAKGLNLEPSRYFLAGMLHDIGKINMAEHPLKTKNKLTQKERKSLKKHVLLGVLLLSELGFGNDIVQFCLRHHERLDGSGYPFGVSEVNISIEGRIAQVSDVFSALTSNRTYRDNVYTYEEALQIIKEDLTFDQSVVEVLSNIIQHDEIENRVLA